MSWYWTPEGLLHPLRPWRHFSLNKLALLLLHLHLQSGVERSDISHQHRSWRGPRAAEPRSNKCVKKQPEKTLSGGLPRSDISHQHHWRRGPGAAESLASGAERNCPGESHASGLERSDREKRKGRPATRRPF